jgi:hypothetical protein
MYLAKSDPGSGFYQHLRHHRDPSQNPNQVALEALMEAIFNVSKATYGSRRMVKALKFKG